MRDGFKFKMVARIPFLVTTPGYFVVASEVATMDFLHSRGLPIPEIYGYSPSTDNAAETEYIFMEFIEGTTLNTIWFDLEEEDIISLTCQIDKHESVMMSIDFAAGGSLYYAKPGEDRQEAGHPPRG
jgi:aminoglycoside phosphotransferase (APT) family kinase protein